MGAKPALARKHAQIEQLAKSGTPAKQIAEVLGACVSGVRKYCARQGIALVDVKNILPAAKEEFVRTAPGKGAAELAALFGVSECTIRSWCRKLGVTLVNTFHKGYVITDSGYKLIPAKWHPHANASGYVREHILVMEAHIGRYLNDDECVHHKDRDKLNNAIENLELMTLSEHAALHARAGDTGWTAYHQAQQDIV